MSAIQPQTTAQSVAPSLGSGASDFWPVWLQTAQDSPCSIFDLASEHQKPWRSINAVTAVTGAAARTARRARRNSLNNASNSVADNTCSWPGHPAATRADDTKSAEAEQDDLCDEDIFRAVYGHVFQLQFANRTRSVPDLFLASQAASEEHTTETGRASNVQHQMDLHADTAWTSTMTMRGARRQRPTAAVPPPPSSPMRSGKWRQRASFVWQMLCRPVQLLRLQPRNRATQGSVPRRKSAPCLSHALAAPSLLSPAAPTTAVTAQMSAPGYYSQAEMDLAQRRRGQHSWGTDVQYACVQDDEDEDGNSVSDFGYGATAEYTEVDATFSVALSPSSPSPPVIWQGGRGGLVSMEQYLRDDIPCCSPACSSDTCAEALALAPNAVLLPENATHYMVPDDEVARRFPALLQHPDLTGVILMQTCLRMVKSACSRRQHTQLAKHFRDKRSQSIIFRNENHAATWRERHANESAHAHALRLARATASWYTTHLNNKVRVVIVTYTHGTAAQGQEDVRVGGTSDDHDGRVHVLDLRAYIEQFHSNSPTLLDDFAAMEAELSVDDDSCDGQRTPQIGAGVGGGARANELGFTEYLSTSAIIAGINTGEFVRGRIHVFKCVLVVPFDSRLPFIRVATTSPAALENKRLVVRIDSWPVASRFPNGHITEILGNAGDVATETKCLLIENTISVPPFSTAQLREMPVNTRERPWRMADDEIRRRRDIRHSHLVFSIDPLGCEDVDDALGVRRLDNGNIELSVHIADVSYFVTPNTFTDAEARARGTTVYLVNGRHDMLPVVLSADLCSLLADQDRYAMSVFWELDSERNVVSTWFGRTVIRSSYQLHYELAQAIFDGLPDQNAIEQLPKLAKMSSHDATKRLARLRDAISLLITTARALKAKRADAGGLELESDEVRFKVSTSDPAAIVEVARVRH
ncbi:hypothetical protein PTSG_06376 [Salpingoeca rosetta]|uniref:DIS3-like exonuclease 1 n=1 Tax=Salpingoeca rosetta (strain ATCC 50818 / BSB-021) TaxID=946362 RepID=F2UCQ8_SALR5|nr:uncharacterized protein PTSG_06376 [Salpingoeca rosetta]EGD74365.1 hypothetical protein PTSG_06376 [Salpingoeca rosetta]|eukprot:XP_004993265.1 hypothetical protein PTSG_06376 [Salpingoeca rosetta]